MSAFPAPLLIELDAPFWSTQLDRAQTFLGNAVLLHARFRTLAHDTLAKVAQPQFHTLLSRVAANTDRHNHALDDFHRLIGRPQPGPARSLARSLTGSLAAKGSQLLGSVEGLAGGTAAPWDDLRQLWLASHAAEGAFAVVEQLGYALALKDLAELAHKLTNEKHRDTLLIQELVLEMAAVAVLYPDSPETSFGPRTTETTFLPDPTGTPPD